MTGSYVPMFVMASLAYLVALALIQIAGAEAGRGAVVTACGAGTHGCRRPSSCGRFLKPSVGT